MRRWLGFLLLLLLVGCTAGTGKGPASAPAGAAAGSAPAAGPPPETPPASLPADPRLNPHVTFPTGPIQVAPDLPVVTPPPGFLRQAEIEARTLAAMGRGEIPGPWLTLSAMRFDPANGMWEVEFATGGRVAAAPGSRPGPVFSSQDPAEQRREERSMVVITAALLEDFDGRTGESRGGGFRGKQPDRTPAELEHYRGRLVSGGEFITLRLINQDGSREGRDIRVGVPQAALGNLSLWQLNYGAGRIVDVWGLTGSRGTSPGIAAEVAAYLVTMRDPPDAALTQLALDGVAPMHPAATFTWIGEAVRTQAERSPLDPEAMRAWYEATLPAYGWTVDRVARAGGAVQLFCHNAAWRALDLRLTPRDGGSLVQVQEHEAA